jgi:hypothetical protein
MKAPPARHWRTYGNDKLPTGADALRPRSAARRLQTTGPIEGRFAMRHSHQRVAKCTASMSTTTVATARHRTVTRTGRIRRAPHHGGGASRGCEARCRRGARRRPCGTIQRASASLSEARCSRLRATLRSASRSCAVVAVAATSRYSRARIRNSSGAGSSKDLREPSVIRC